LLLELAGQTGWTLWLILYKKLKEIERMVAPRAVRFANLEIRIAENQNRLVTALFKSEVGHDTLMIE
jgi:hypothetical protein